MSVLESDFINDLQENKPFIRDHPYRYHNKLLALLLATTLISNDKSVYNPNHADIE